MEGEEVTHLGGSHMYTFNKTLVEKIKTKQAKHFRTEIRVSLQERKSMSVDMKEFTFW